MAEIKIDVEKCKGCGLCVLYCPKGLLAQSKSFNKKGVYPVEFIEKDVCSGCSFCAIICPDMCITVYR
ncbi:MAG: tungsten formylmethanofuran dehydrogenase [Candidatus Omnitrophica bacterium CG12_big_fil_rev_8_21_14_0_65_42_8]|nr:MAG: tungsten formylmethanofuran dehydrogenase [Candidatus Omnitrophica bacterium CG12_big_fil_rev_8_21_14_0_65_42_8]